MIKPEFEQRVTSLQMKMLQAILETYVWGKPDPHLPTGEIYEALVRLIARLVSEHPDADGVRHEFPVMFARNLSGHINAILDGVKPTSLLN